MAAAGVTPLPPSSTSDAAGRTLTDMPVDIIERIVLAMPLSAIVSASAASRLFRGAPGRRSPVEHALRERAHARGHHSALPETLPTDACTWIEELLVRERITALACAHARVAAASRTSKLAFSAFVGAEGGLHTCGEEAVGDEEPAVRVWCAPTALGHSAARASVPPVPVPTRVPSLSAVRVVAVAAGWDHLLALSEAGAVYGCGENEYGQLGLGDTAPRHGFVRLDGAVSPETTACIAAGAAYSFASSVDGCVYSWGHNSCGQLGHGDTEDRLEPTRIEALRGVRVGGVSAGMAHVLVLAAHGAVYSCGGGHLGRLGHGDRQHQHTPRRIEALAGLRAVHVSAGVWHSLVVDDEGAVHAFGSGACLCPEAQGVDWPAPAPVESLARVRAVRARAGNRGSVVLGADGSVHTLGVCSGLVRGAGYTALQPPARVAALSHERVVGCAPSRDLALFVTADGAAYSSGSQSAALGLGLSREHGTADRRTPTRVTELPPLRRVGSS